MCSQWTQQIFGGPSTHPDNVGEPHWHEAGVILKEGQVHLQYFFRFILIASIIILLTEDQDQETYEDGSLHHCQVFNSHSLNRLTLLWQAVIFVLEKETHQPKIHVQMLDINS